MVWHIEYEIFSAIIVIFLMVYFLEVNLYLLYKTKYIVHF